jgi:O-antigen/teichoic acid export membrane protein
LIITKFLPLQEMGYYAIAGTATGALPLISISVVTAFFPRFSAQSSVDDKTSLIRNYRRATQVITFSTVGPALALVFFSFDILMLWTQSADVAHQTSRVLSLLALAGLLNAIQNPAYTLLVAHGSTRIPLFVNGLNVIIFIPIMLTLIPVWGLEGAATIWLIQNLISLLVYSFFVHKIVFKDRIKLVFTRDVAVYVLLGSLWMGGARLLTFSNVATPISYLSLLLAGIGYCLSTLLLSRSIEVFPLELLPWLAWLKRT